MKAGPSISPEDVARLVKVLETAPGWLTAAALSQALFGNEAESGKRRIRAIANAAGDAIVSYPGSPGYRLWQRCTIEELETCHAAWNAQIEDMERRRALFVRRLYRAHPAKFAPDPALRPTREQLTLL